MIAQLNKEQSCAEGQDRAAVDDYVDIEHLPSLAVAHRSERPSRGKVGVVDDQIAGVTGALIEQWPVATVILITLIKGIRTAAQHVTALLAKIESMDAHQREQAEQARRHGDRVEAFFASLIASINDSIKPLSERSDRHSAEIRALSGQFQILDDRVIDLEGSRRSRYPSASEG